MSDKLEGAADKELASSLEPSCLQQAVLDIAFVVMKQKEFNLEKIKNDLSDLLINRILESAFYVFLYIASFFL